jgi:hypothetical protein
MPRSVNLDDVVMVAKKLAALDTKVVFTGGSIVSLLLDNPNLTPIRVTNDVDVIAEVFTHIEFTELEERLRKLQFHHDTSEGAPACRWLADGVKVDIMPMRDPASLRNPWFEIAVHTAQPVKVRDQTLLLVTAPCFLAMKILAFNNRGENDFMGSHDFEDVLSIVDGRAALVDEVAQADPGTRKYVCGELARFLADTRFRESLPGHLPSDAASQQRLPGLEQKLHALAALPHA